MKVLWVLLTVVLGVLGAGSILRAVEVMFFGGGTVTPVAQLATGLVFLLLAWLSFKKARAS